MHMQHRGAASLERLKAHAKVLSIDEIRVAHTDPSAAPGAQIATLDVFAQNPLPAMAF